MTDKCNEMKVLPPRDSNPDMLIQSQQVTLTGTVKDIEFLLKYLGLQRGWHRVTVTLTPTSVPDAQGSVTEQSQQKSRQDGEA